MTEHDRPHLTLVRDTPGQGDAPSAPPAPPAAPPAAAEPGHPEPRPILPAWLTTRPTEQAGSWARRAAHHTLFHGLRAPVYAWRLVGQAARGGRLGVAVLYEYLNAVEYVDVVQDAKAAGDSTAVKLQKAERRTQRKTRLKGAALVATGAAGVVQLGYGMWGPAAYWAAGGAVFLAALAAGRRTADDDSPILEEPEMPAKIDLAPEHLNAAFRAAGLLKDSSAALTLVQPILRDGKGWGLVADMPRGGGKTAADAIAKRDTIAAELGVDEIQLIMDRVRAHDGGHGGRLSMWVADDDPYMGPPTPSPLASMERFDLWSSPIPFGQDARGRRVDVDVKWQSMFFGGLPRRGKALALDTPVPTPTGWTTMGELVDGDMVYDENGQPCRVLRAWPVRQDRPCYEVEFSDGSVIVADAEHLWSVDTRASRMSAHAQTKPRNPASPFSRPQQHKRAMPQVLTTEEMAGKVRVANDHRLNYSVRVARPLQNPDADLPVPPYTLGAWLGDGTSITGVISCRDTEIIDVIESEGERTRLIPPTADKCPGYRILGLHGRLRQIGVLGNKHIPVAYLRASEAQRRALLAGLLDTDGYAVPDGRVQFTSTKERLARDVLHLAATLGYKPTLRSKKATLNGKDCGTAWNVTFVASEPVFRLPRKRERQALNGNATRGHRFVVDIRPVPSVPVRCITVDSPNSLYLVGEACIPTHNTFTQRLLSAAAVLDPYTDHYVADFKGGQDWVPIRQVAVGLVLGAEDDALVAFEAMLDEVISEMGRRFALLRDLPPSICPEGKLTPQIQRKYGLNWLFLTIDELQEALTALDKEGRERVIDKLCRIARRGPAAGIISNDASQRPDSDSVPTKLREIITIRYSTQVVDRTSSDMVLGKGKAAQGADASILQEEHKGVGVLVTGPSNWVTVKADYLDGPAFAEVCARGRWLRQEAGTLKGEAVGDVLAVAEAAGRQIPQVLNDVLTVMRHSDRMHTHVILTALENLDPEAYGDWDADRLAAELAAVGVERSGRQVKIDGENRSGYRRADLEAAMPVQAWEGGPR